MFAVIMKTLMVMKHDSINIIQRCHLDCYCFSNHPIQMVIQCYIDITVGTELLVVIQ